MPPAFGLGARDLPLVVAGRDLPLAWRSPSTGRGTILLVEDEDGLRALNARGLASRGYTVLEAGNGVWAIDVLQKADGQVDLVVSDVVMPEMDGPTLLRELRNSLVGCSRSRSGMTIGALRLLSGDLCQEAAELQ